MEMNLHAPQSVEAATELREIAAVPLQIVSPRESVPLVSVVQDTLVGANRFTRPNVLFTKKEAMNLLVHAKRWDGKLPAPVTTDPQPMWSGQQLLSTLLPPVSMEMPNSSYGDEDKKNPQSQNLVKIYKGQIYQGILDKSVFGKQLLQVIFNDYGPDVTVDFLDSLQAMIANFLMNSGFSVGISDLIADESTNAEINVALQKLSKSIEDQILQLHTGLFENSSGRSNQEEFEAKVMGTLNKAVGEAGKIGLKSLADTNRMTNMVKAGSKGSDVNVSQMIATLGQQAIEGKRVPNGFQHRTLPHFKRFDDSAKARGFIASSYIKGLQPDEFFFHAMSGREGLIDTAVKTADTGYLQRQIRVALEDLITQHDGSVRDAMGNLLQLAYGEDGANATKIEGQAIALAGMSDDDIRAEFAAEGAAGADEYVKAVIADRNMLVEKVFLGKPAKSVKYPVHLERTIVAIKQAFNLSADTAAITAQEVLEAQEKVLIRTHKHNALWAALIHYHMSPVKMQKHGFTRVALDALVEQLVLKHWKSWVEPGQPIGVIAAQSIGEPCTQMSMVYDTKIVINSKDSQYNGPIGAYIDALLEKHKEAVVDLGDDSVVLDLLAADGAAIVGVSTDEKTSWLPIQQVSRHPAHGGLVKVTTRTGRSTTATLSHSFLKRGPAGIEAVKGSDLCVGDRIPVATHMSQVPSPITSVAAGATTYALDREFGWVCGMYVADGCLPPSVVSISKMDDAVETKLSAFAARYGHKFSSRIKQGEYGPNKDNIIHSSELRAFLDSRFSHSSFEKRIADFVFHAPIEFIAGFVGGYFDGDGNVNVDRQQVRLSSRNAGLIRDTNRLLGYLGLFGWMGEERTVRVPDAVQYTLNIPKSRVNVFAEAVGFTLPEKAAALAQVLAYVNRADRHAHQEHLDKIPALGDVLAATGELLGLRDQSRTFGRWAKKESIGRDTLRDYIAKAKEGIVGMTDSTKIAQIQANIAVLESAANGDVLWDEIVELTLLDDPQAYVYDFTVPGNDSFMVDDNILVHNTLNSVDWHTEIVIAKDGVIQTPRIGEFIDAYINSCDSSRIQRHPNDQLYVELNDGHDWKAISCDETGKMMWTKLEAITKHPVVNEDGTDTILEVVTESGRTVKATKAKSFLVYADGKFVPTNGSDLNVGDALPIANSLAIDGVGVISCVPNTSIQLTKLVGLECGLYLASANSDSDMIRTMFGEILQVPTWMYQAPVEFLQGLISGFCKNTVIVDETVKLTNSKEVMKGVVVILARFGIFTTQSHAYERTTIQISGQYIQQFVKVTNVEGHIGLPRNINDTVGDVALDKVKAIKEIKPFGDRVYDVTVQHTKNFLDHNLVVNRDTFHLAGVAAKSNMTRGVPRMKELLKATHNPKAIELQIPLRRDLRDKKEEARRVSQELEFTLLQDLVTTARIYFDPRDNATLIAEDADWLAYMAAFEAASRPTGAAAAGAGAGAPSDALAGAGAGAGAPPQETPKSPWILRFELDRERMFAKNITMDDIAFILRSKFGNDLETVYTDYNATRLVFRARLRSDRVTATGKKALASQNVDDLDDLNELKLLQNKVLSATAVRGIPGLRSVNYQKISDTFEYSPEDGKYKPVDQYMLISDGSNFLDVLCHPDVDPTRLVSSNIHDMMANLGIEATRATLFKEITTLFAESGTGVNYRHVSVLIDKMCHKGRVMSVDRYGINKNDIGPLAKMSFEQTEDIALRAAMFGERDPCLGVSAKVMLGAPIKAGTSFSEVLYDEAAAMSLAASTPEQRPAPSTGPAAYTGEDIENTLYGVEEDDSECGMSAIRMNVSIPAAPLVPIEEELEEDVDIAIVE
jgi:DNA-directed RNA polymerase beta' subunit